MLADFVAKFTPAPRASIGICQVTVKCWQMYMDGASNARRSRVKAIMVFPKGLRLKKSLRLGFRTLNNKAEYETLIAGL